MILARNRNWVSKQTISVFGCTSHPGKAEYLLRRKFRVGFEISGITGAGGEIMSIDGNMNAIGDAVVGEFNISTKTFTPASEIPGA